MRKRENKTDTEVEYKFKVKDKKALVALLDKKARKKKKKEYQKMVIFDNPQGLMQKNDGRVRISTLGMTGNRILTYKKPIKSENRAKREIEYEIKFTNRSGQIEKILEAMELATTTSYERYRTEWQIKNVHITLDEYPYSDFVEIEGPKRKIEEIARKLGFDPKEGLTKPVDTLFQEWRKERDLPSKTHMRFEDFDK